MTRFGLSYQMAAGWQEGRGEISRRRVGRVQRVPLSNSRLIRSQRRWRRFVPQTDRTYEPAWWPTAPRTVGVGNSLAIGQFPLDGFDSLEQIELLHREHRHRSPRENPRRLRRHLSLCTADLRRRIPMSNPDSCGMVRVKGTTVVPQVHDRISRGVHRWQQILCPTEGTSVSPREGQRGTATTNFSGQGQPVSLSYGRPLSDANALALGPRSESFGCRSIRHDQGDPPRRCPPCAGRTMRRPLGQTARSTICPLHSRSRGPSPLTSRIPAVRGRAGSSGGRRSSCASG